MNKLTDELQGLYEAAGKAQDVRGIEYHARVNEWRLAIREHWPTILAALKAADELAEAGHSFVSALDENADERGMERMENPTLLLQALYDTEDKLRAALASYTAIREDEK